MIGKFFKMNGIKVKLVKEENYSSCLGCYFSELDENGNHIECLFKSEDYVFLECGNVNGIYKKISLEKGIKKKITLNQSLP
jgi:hypothetical protein